MTAPARRKSLALCVLAYLVAGAAAVGVAMLVRDRHPITVAAVADLAATLVVFAFSVAVSNTSMYDPFWSVAPVPIAGYWALHSSSSGAVALRQVVLVALVGVWAVRLTANWVRRWQGLGHEDWRYAGFRRRAGRAYWVLSLFGFHLLPTVVVFGACLPLYAALSAGRQPLGWLDALAAVVTALAIWIEATADWQLHRFLAARPAPEQTLTTGLWAYCRHPNYFGEVLFWWGLALFALAAAPSFAWTVAGAIAMTALFVFISVPLIDRRMIERRPGYRERIKRVPALVPWFPK